MLAFRSRSLQTCRYINRAPYRQNSTASDSIRPPFPFLWPSLPQAPDAVPRVMSPLITANPKNLGDKLYVWFMSLFVRFPNVNRALNIGWITMLLTRSVFPAQFMGGSIFAFEEFLRRLNKGEDVTELVTPQFAKIVYDHLGDPKSPSNVSENATISLSKGGSMGVRDAWIFLGAPTSFAQAEGKWGGLLKSKDTHDPNSSTLFVQLPFTSVVQTKDQEVPLALQAEEGLQVAVDVQITGNFKFTYQEEEMTQERVAVVRFVSQPFTGKSCRNNDERNKRIFQIRDSLQWSIADIDYIWSERNWVDQIAKD